MELAFSSLKRLSGLGETLATTLMGLATRIVTKMTPYYTYALYNAHLEHRLRSGPG